MGHYRIVRFRIVSDGNMRHPKGDIVKIADRKAIAARSEFSLATWDEDTVSAFLNADLKSSAHASWVQGLFCLVNGDIVPDTEKGGFKGAAMSYGKLADARNEKLAGKLGVTVGELGSVWAKGTMSKGVAVLTTFKSYDEIMELSAAELSAWVTELSELGALSTVYAQMFPPKQQDDKDPLAVLGHLVSNCSAYAAKHGLNGEFGAMLQTVLGQLNGQV